MTHTRWWLASAGWLAWVGLTGLQTTAAAPQMPVPVSVLARVQAPGARVRVIVGHRAGRQPETALSSDVAIARQRADHADAVRSILAGTSAGLIDHVRTFEALPYFAAEVDATALAALAASPLVGSIEEDVPRPPALSESVPMIEGPEAWSAGFSGAGWSVAILDTGIEGTHPFLSGKVVSEACYSTTETGLSTSLCPGGLEETTAAGAATPCGASIAGCEHGTHVAGIAAGSGPLFSGVARDATVVAIQVFSQFGPPACGGLDSCALAWDSDVLAGLDRVYALRASLKIASVNLSLGSSTAYPGFCDTMSSALKTAIDDLRAAGIATVVAAGNAQSNGALSFPACISTAISVGSTTKLDAVSSFSNTSNLLSLLAPGDPINSSLPGGGFGYRRGTSMAAPHVTGAWAVLKQRKPSAGVAEILFALHSTGRGVTDARPQVGETLTLPRIRIKAALEALGAPTSRMAVDSPGAGVVRQPFRVAGWAVDRAAAVGSGVDAVHVWAYPTAGGPPVFAGAATLGGPRGDVGAAFGSQFGTSGFSLDVAGLAPGAYSLVVSAHSVPAAAFDQSRLVAIAIAASWPMMSVDTPGESEPVGRTFTLAGWAVDRAASTGPGVDVVHVWAFPATGGPPVFVGQASYGGARADVGAAFGDQFTGSGYSLEVNALPPGTYDLGIYPHSAIAGSFNQMKSLRVVVQ